MSRGQRRRGLITVIAGSSGTGASKWARCLRWGEKKLTGGAELFFNLRQQSNEFDVWIYNLPTAWRHGWRFHSSQRFTESENPLHVLSVFTAIKADWKMLKRGKKATLIIRVAIFCTLESFWWSKSRNLYDASMYVVHFKKATPAASYWDHIWEHLFCCLFLVEKINPSFQFWVPFWAL